MTTNQLTKPLLIQLNIKAEFSSILENVTHIYNTQLSKGYHLLLLVFTFTTEMLGTRFHSNLRI